MRGPRPATVAALVGLGRMGIAAARFTALYEEWRRSAQGVSDALNGMGGLLGSVAASYQQHEADMAARIGALL